MIFLRSVLFNIAFFGFTATVAVVVSPALFMPGSHVLGLAQWWARSVLVILRVVAGIRVKVTGEEHLPRSGPALIAAKHQSAFDTIVWLALLPSPTYVLKAELLKIPFYGRFTRRSGMIAVDRSAGGAAMRGMLRAADIALSEGRQIVIFPQGTRVAAEPGTTAAHPYQPGVSALYARAGLPMLPVATDSGRFWARRSFIKRPGTLTVALLPPIPPGLSRAAFEATMVSMIEQASDALLTGPVDKSVGERAGAA